ncbi:MAG: hypothetical protein ACQKBY_09520 [Verrucomicrobiales bacterium]
MKTIALVLCVLSGFVASLSADDVRSQIRELGRAKMKLEREMSKIFREEELASAEYEELSQEVFQAAQELSKAQRSHPDLKPLFEKSDELQSKSVKAKVAGDDAGYKKAMSEFIATRSEIYRKTAMMEDFKDEKANLDQKRARLDEMERAALAKSPAGQKLIKESEALEKKLEALRESR